MSDAGLRWPVGDVVFMVLNSTNFEPRLPRLFGLESGWDAMMVVIWCLKTCGTARRRSGRLGIVLEERRWIGINCSSPLNGRFMLFAL